MIDLDERELATVLAALRYWQQDLARQHPHDDDSGPISPHFEAQEPLAVEQIDRLCERLNTDAPTCARDDSYVVLCRRLAETAANWADCSDLREVLAVFKELGDDARRLMESQPEPASTGRHVLYDFDADELATTRVYGSYAEAVDDANQLHNVLILTLPLEAKPGSGCDSEDASDEPCDCELPGPFCSGVPGILARVEDGRVVPGTEVQRCDACERYPSDESARDRLIELGLASGPRSEK
jgi:hypothetical protein